MKKLINAIKNFLWPPKLQSVCVYDKHYPNNVMQWYIVNWAKKRYVLIDEMNHDFLMNKYVGQMLDAEKRVTIQQWRSLCKKMKLINKE